MSREYTHTARAAARRHIGPGRLALPGNCASTIIGYSAARGLDPAAATNARHGRTHAAPPKPQLSYPCHIYPCHIVARLRGRARARVCAGGGLSVAADPAD